MIYGEMFNIKKLLQVIEIMKHPSKVVIGSGILTPKIREEIPTFGTTLTVEFYPNLLLIQGVI